MFGLLGRGDIDLLVLAWLPASHGGYLRPIADKVRKLAILYKPYCIWGVPDDVPSGAVSSVQDLLKPAVLKQMDRDIQGINPGAAGTLDRIKRIARVEGTLNVAPGFTATPAVLNGASHMINRLFGEHGRHSRAISANPEMPLDCACLIYLWAELA